MVATKTNAPHKRRRVTTNSSKKVSNIIPRKNLLVDRETDELTILGHILMTFMALFVLSQGAIVVAPLYWLGLITI